MKIYGRYIFITLVITALVMTAGLFDAPAFASEDLVSENKTDPEIEYHVPDDLDLLDEGFNLQAKTINCDAMLTYSSIYPALLEVDQSGNVTILKHDQAFSAPIRISVSETDTTKAKDFLVNIYVDWVPQTITCQKTSYTTTLGTNVTIKASAGGQLSYTSSEPATATVNSSGVVKFRHPGSVTITVRAAEYGIYWTAQKSVTVSCKMKAPKLTTKRLKHRRVKLTWTKVGGAGQYMIYVKYPGTDTFKPMVSKSYKVKSVTHKNLKKKKKYSYKVRAYLVVDGDIYYGPFSNTKTVKIK